MFVGRCKLCDVGLARREATLVEEFRVSDEIDDANDVSSMKRCADLALPHDCCNVIQENDL